MQSEKTQIYHCRWRDISCPDSISWHVVGLCDMGWSSAAPPTPLTLLAMQLTESGYNVQQRRWESILTQEKQKKPNSPNLFGRDGIWGSQVNHSRVLSFTVFSQLVYCLLWKPGYCNNNTWFFFSIYYQWIWKLLMLFKPHLTPVK